MDDETGGWMGHVMNKNFTMSFTIQVCVYLTVHITKLQLQIDENINIVIEFNPYMPKFSK
jgi:hypothetical protein